MNKTVQDAYRIVYNDMLNSECGLLVGKFDAKNGSGKYMSGVCMVMEWIAYHVNEETGNDFTDLFAKNIVKSIAKANEV